MTRVTGHGMVSLSLALLVVLAAANPASGGSGSNVLTPGGAGVIDRVAYAVDAAESSHGSDPGMWRSEPNGPQGPMQISAAAATDAGAGDRFDERQNRALGRAYLAHLYRRYGSWADAVAAYNWGPSRMDGWIGNGRAPDKLPPEVARYRVRVLAASGLATAPAALADGAGKLLALRLGIVHMQPRRPLADRRRPGNLTDKVELLYAEIMKATDPSAR